MCLNKDFRDILLRDLNRLIYSKYLEETNKYAKKENFRICLEKLKVCFLSLELFEAN